MIVKMIILRFLGSSDDKEKIDKVRPEGPPLRGFRYPVSGRGSRRFYTGLTDVEENVYVGALADEDRGNYIHRLNR